VLVFVVIVVIAEVFGFIEVAELYEACVDDVVLVTVTFTCVMLLDGCLPAPDEIVGI
jgi:hypothetical protein